MLDRGLWDWDTQYEQYDFVTFDEDHQGYICLVANKSIVPGTDSTVWAVAVGGGADGENVLREKTTYTSGETSVSGLAWDTLHVFPEISSLAFTLASIPNDGKAHQMVIIFDTPADVSNFTFSPDPSILWANNVNLASSIQGSKQYVININSGSMIAIVAVESGTEDTRQLKTISGVAIPTGTDYKIPLFTNVAPSLVSYASNNTSIATVDNEGVVTGVAPGTAEITIDWAGLTDSVSVYVGPQVKDTTAIPSQDRTIDQVVIINPRASLEVGDEYALYAVGISNALAPKYDVGYYNPIKFISSNPAVAQVTFGTLVAVGTGTCTITATDLNGNASDSFTINVVAKTEPAATAAETYSPTIDNTGQTDVTADIAAAIAYAAANGYKKVSFAQGTYKMSGDNRPNNVPISLPSNMIVDFNGSDVYFDSAAAVAVTGYKMFLVESQENVWLRNVNIYGENYGLSTLIRREGDLALTISGNSKNIHVENCAFKWSPGFNVGIGFNMRGRSGFPPNAVTPGSVEAGGLDEYGNDTTESATWRTTYKSWGFSHGYWILGFFQGTQNARMRSRIYDIYFYDSNKTLLGRKVNCYIFQRYDLPEGISPSYCRIVFYQTEEPTTYDLDYHGFVHICDNLNPQDIYFKNCIFQNAISTGLSPQGGVHVVVDGCTFIDNGYRDPYSHIDWEDGRQSAQGHIVKNCTFLRNQLTSNYNCQVINGYCRNVTLHDNLFKKASLRAGSESTMQRCYHNAFEGGLAPSIGGKMDSIFAGNVLDATPTINAPDIAGTHTISVDNEVLT